MEMSFLIQNVLPVAAVAVGAIYIAHALRSTRDDTDMKEAEAALAEASDIVHSNVLAPRKD